jgi:hypothetical protein
MAVNRFFWIILFVPALFLFAPAYGLDFVTRNEFVMEKDSFKNYPLNILFKKFVESKETEKRKLRNLIVLKMVFDRETEEKIAPGGVKYQETFCLISDITPDHMRIRIPESGDEKDLYVGMDRIPLENPGKFPITALNIHRYAMVVYSLDERIYKLAVSFPLSAPQALTVTRKNGDNLLEWRQPQGSHVPIGYRVFVNDLPVASVEGAMARIPRTQGRIDAYQVRALYSHGSSVVESLDSKIVVDAISSEELGKRREADELYSRIKQAVTPLQWHTARKLLYDNQGLLERHLGQEARADIFALIDFFKTIDSGDALMARQPPTNDDFDSAANYFTEAEQKARDLPSEIRVMFIVRFKNGELFKMRTLMENREMEVQVTALYDRIKRMANPTQWQTARALLHDNREMLERYLTGDRKALVVDLSDFFRKIEAGDQVMTQEPVRFENYYVARSFYNDAEHLIESLPREMSFSHLVRSKKDHLRQRVAQLTSSERLGTAQKIYDRIVAALNAGEWKHAKALLFENQELLTDTLEGSQRSDSIHLAAFFREIDAGDEIGSRKPESIDNIGSALAFYGEAARRAEKLSENIGVAFVVRLKEVSAREKMARLRVEKTWMEARSIYDRILAGLNLSEWEKSRQSLYDHQEFLATHLTDPERSLSAMLAAFFRDLDAGDRVGSREPMDIENLKSAMAFYQRAEMKAKTLAENIDVMFVVRMKAGENRKIKNQLESLSFKRLARERFREAEDLLTAAEWEKAKNFLYANKPLFMAHLDDNGKVSTLMAIFRDLDAGDALLAGQPVTNKNRKMADAFYRQAERRVAGLVLDADLLLFVRQRLDANKISDTVPTDNDVKARAETMLDRIKATLTATGWESSRDLLYENEQLLSGNQVGLSPGEISLLINFFRDIDAGDRLVTQQPETEKNLEMAMVFYDQAADKASSLAEAVHLDFLVQQKRSAGQKRMSRAEENRKIALARETFRKILAALNPGQWPEAKKRLNDNPAFLLHYLDKEEKLSVQRLLDFFKDIDAGDRQAHQQPENQENFQAALELYRRAQKKGDSLISGVDISFVVQQKVQENRQRAEQLEDRTRQRAAGEICHQILEALNPSEWEKARTMLYDNLDLLTTHLDGDLKDITARLTEFFREMDVGDRAAGRQPESLTNYDMAMEFYKQAEKKIGSLPPELDLSFIVRQKTDDIFKRTVILEGRGRKVLAKKVYTRIIEALQATRWQEVRKLLDDNHKLMASDLDEGLRENTTVMATFFKRIDAGDRLAGLDPPTENNLQSAMDIYRQAGTTAEVLPEDMDLFFVVQLKVDEAQKKMALLEKNSRRESAEALYQKIENTLNPYDWNEARQLLDEHHQELTEHLEESARANILRLAGFFRDIDEGDRTARQVPESILNLEMALTFYKHAEQKAGYLSGWKDLLFITQEKIDENLKHTALLETRSRGMQAEESFRQIKEHLNLSQWQEAKEYLYGKQQFLTDYLHGEKRAAAEKLVDFFRDIDAGDRMAAEKPESVKNYDMALTFYEHADRLATLFSETVDVRFIARLRINETLGVRDQLKEIQQEQAAQANKGEEPEPLSLTLSVKKSLLSQAAPEPVVLLKPIDQAVKDFNERKYTSALANFSKAFPKQVNRIRKPGKKQIGGLLALPSKYRAEVVFLLELERIMGKSKKSDKKVFRKGLETLYDKIENGQGLWVIIPEARKSMIKDHIYDYLADLR